MNETLLLRVADAIESHPNNFNLAQFVDWTRGAGGDSERSRLFDLIELVDDCGTVGCVAGFTAAIMLEDDPSIPEPTMESAAGALGLIDAQHWRLFYAGRGSVWAEMADKYGWSVDDGSLKEWSEVLGWQAAEVLRDIANDKIPF